MDKGTSVWGVCNYSDASMRVWLHSDFVYLVDPYAQCLTRRLERVYDSPGCLVLVYSPVDEETSER